MSAAVRFLSEGRYAVCRPWCTADNRDLGMRLRKVTINACPSELDVYGYGSLGNMFSETAQSNNKQKHANIYIYIT